MRERIFVIGEEGTRRDRFAAAYKIAAEMLKGGAIELILRHRKSKRSHEQNKRYWAILREVSASAWINGRQFSDEVWHEQFKRWFIGMDELPDGTQRGMSTTSLTVAEFGDYMTQIEAWCADQGFPLMGVAA